MDMVTIAKEYVDMQKRAANSYFDAVRLFQDFADSRSQYWADQMSINEPMKAVINEWRVVLRKGRDDSIKMVNDGFKFMETYLAGLSRQEDDE